MTDSLTRRLVLLRHARAESVTAAGDHARVLAAVGRLQASSVGVELAREVPQFDVALVSDAARTRETFGLLADAHPGLPDPTLLTELYLASPEGVLDCLAAVPDEVSRVLVVAHEPTMSMLTLHLAGGVPRAAASLELGMGTGEAAVLSTTTSWRELRRGVAQLDMLLRPS